MARWYIGALVALCVCSLVRSCVGAYVLMRLSIGALVPLLVHWRVGELVRFFDALESWSVGALVRWCIEELLRMHATGSQR